MKNVAMPPAPSGITWMAEDSRVWLAIARGFSDSQSGIKCSDEVADNFIGWS
jgi:hypothetical protein